ncbi:MAG: hypothetical protein HY720_10825 [Planctomycetes bacterium]|nr:hypothetical protein [Planctomycetota bacterium]
MTLSGDFTSSGTYTAGTSTFSVAGSPSTVRGSVATTFHHVVIQPAATLAVNTATAPANHIRLTGNWDNHGAFTQGTSTVTFLGNPSVIDSAIPADNVTTVNHLTIASGASVNISPTGVASIDVQGTITNNSSGTGFTPGAHTVRFVGTSGAVAGSPIAIDSVAYGSSARLTLDGTDDLTVNTLMTIPSGATLRLQGTSKLRLGTGLVLRGSLLASSGSTQTVTDTGTRFRFTVDLAAPGDTLDLDDVSFSGPDANGLDVLSTSTQSIDLDGVAFTGGNPTTGVYVRLGYATISAGTFSFSGCTFDANCLYNVRTPATVLANGAVAMTGFGGAKGDQAYEDDRQAGVIDPGSITWQVITWDNGGGNRLWSNPTNWNPDGLPPSNSRIVIPQLAPGPADDPILNLTTTVGSIQVKDGGTITSDNGGRVLTVTGNVGTENVASPGSIALSAADRISIGGSLTADGSFSHAGANLNITGSVAVGTGGSFSSSGTGAVIQGSLTSSGSLVLDTGSIRIEGSFSNSGTFQPTSGTVTLGKTSGAGSGNVTLGTGRFYNLRVLANYTYTATDGLTIGDGAGGQLDVDGTLRLSQALVFNSGSTFDATAGLVSYAGSSIQSVAVPPGGAYYNLEIANTGSGVANAAGNLSARNFTIQLDGEFAAGGYVLNLDGDFTNSGTFNAGSGRVNFRGNPSVIRGSSVTTFYDLSIDYDNAVTALLSIDVAPGSLTVLSTWTNNEASGFVPGSTTVLFGGATSTVAGSQTTEFYNLTIASGATLSISPATSTLQIRGTLTNSGNGISSGSHTVEFTGTAGQFSGSAITFNILRIVGKLTLDGTDSVTVADGTTGFVVPAGGTFVMNGTSTLRLGQGATNGRALIQGTLTTSGATPTITRSGTGRFSFMVSGASSSVDVNALAFSYCDANGFRVDSTASTSLDLDSASFTNGPGTAGSIYINLRYASIAAGQFNFTSCSFDAATQYNVHTEATVAANGAVSMNGASGAQGDEAFEDDRASGVISGGSITWASFTWTNGTGDGLWSTPGNWNPSGPPAAGSKVVIPADSSHAPAGGPTLNSTTSIGSLTIQDGGTATTGAGSVNFTVTGSLVTDPSVSLGGGVLTFGGTGTLTVGGAFTNSGTFTKNGSGTLSLASLANAGSFTHNAGPFSVTGNLTTSGSLVIGTATVSGNFVRSAGTVSTGTGTVTLSGASGTVTGMSGASSFAGLAVPASSTYRSTDALGIGGLANVDGRLEIQTSLSFGGGASFDATAGTVAYVGTSDQSVVVPPGGSYYALEIANTGASIATLAGNATVQDLSIPADGGFALGANTLKVRGLFTNSGAFSALAGGIVDFIGTASRVKGSSTTTFASLAIDLDNAVPGASLGIDTTNSGNTIQVSGTFTNNDSFTASTPKASTVVFTGASSALAGSSTTTFESLTIATGATLSVSASPAAFEVNATWKVDGSYTPGDDTVRFVGSATTFVAGSAVAVYKAAVTGTLTLDAGDAVTVQGDGAAGLTVASGGTLKMIGAAVLRLGTTATAGVAVVSGSFQASGSTPLVTDAGGGSPNRYSFTVTGGGTVALSALTFDRPDANGLRAAATAGTAIDVDGVAFQNGPGSAGSAYLKLLYAAIPSGQYSFLGCSFDALAQFNVHTEPGASDSAVSMGGTSGTRGSEPYEDDRGAGQVPGGSIYWPQSRWTDADVANSLWNNPLNWSPAVVPGANNQVVIDPAYFVGPNSPTLNISTTIGSLRIEAGASVTGDNGARNLTVNGDLTTVAGSPAGLVDFRSTGTFKVLGTLVNGGSVTNTNGGLSPLPILDVQSATNAGSLNLTNFKATGCIVRASLSTSGTLTMAAGDLSVGGNWTQSGTFTAGTGTVLLSGTSVQTVTASSPFYKLTASGSDVRSGGTVTVSNLFSVSSGGKFTLRATEVLDLTASGLTHTVTGTLVLVNPTSDPPAGSPTTLRVGNGSVVQVTGRIQSQGSANLNFWNGNHTNVTRSGGGSYGFLLDVSTAGAIDIFGIRWSYLRGSEDATPAAARFPLVVRIAASGNVSQFKIQHFETLAGAGSPGAANNYGKHDRYLHLYASGGAWNGLDLGEFEFREASLPDEHNVEKNSPGASVTFSGTLGELYEDTWDLDGDAPDGNGPDPGDFEIIFTRPGAVTMESLAAIPYDSSVLVTWRTGSEVKNLGFAVYRSTSPDSGFVQVSRELILGLGDSVSGGTYYFLDRGVTNGIEYFYMVEDVETTGRSALHGPVSARPEAGLGLPDTSGAWTNGGTSDDPPAPPPPPDQPPPPGGDPPGEISYPWIGDPTRWLADWQEKGIRVISFTTAGIVLEILVPEPWIQTVVRDGKEYDEVRIAGYAGSAVRASPVLPELGFRIPVAGVVGGTYEILDARSKDRTGVVPPPFPTLVYDGTGETLPDASYVEDPVWYGGGAFQPGSLFEIGRVSGRGEIDFLPITFHPALFRGSPAALRVFQRVVVRIAFRYADPSGGEPDPEALRIQRRLAADPGALKIRTAADGLVRLRADEIARAGFDLSIDSAYLALYHLGHPVPIEVADGGDGRLGSGDSILFYGRRNARRTTDNPWAIAWSEEEVYWLVADPAGALRIEGTDGAPDPAFSVSPSIRVETHSEEALDWVFEYPAWGGQDLQVGGLAWSYYGTPRETVTSTLDLADPVAGPDPAVLSYSLFGALETPHKVRIEWNGIVMANLEWWGVVGVKGSIPIDPTLLVDGANTCEVVCYGSGPYGYDFAYVNYLHLAHDALPRARGPSYRFTGMAGERYRVSGIPAADVLVLDVTDPELPRRMDGAVAAPDGGGGFAIDFQDRSSSGEAVYELALPAALRGPASIELNRESHLADTANQADWIAVGPADLLAALAPLADARVAQGLVTQVVDVEDVYDEFGFGMKSPEAIRAFVSHAQHNWVEPSPRYLLLVGDGSFDVLDAAGGRLPVSPAKTAFLVVPSDNEFAMVDGDDETPDLAVGRLPCRTAAQVTSVVDKILAYEALPATEPWCARTLLVADDRDIFDFAGGSEELASRLAPRFAVDRAYIDTMPLATARAKITSAIDQGALLVHFSGHGSLVSWAGRQRLLHADDIRARTAHPRLPVVVAMNCLNAHFADPWSDSLGEVMLLTPSRGAVAFWGATSLSDPDSQVYLSRYLGEALAAPGAGRLGDAILDAFERVAGTANYRDLYHSFVLLGDPALCLRLPPD